jgi:hypothetical protein
VLTIWPMPLWGRYLLAAVPALLTVGGWQLAEWASDYCACGGDIKHPQPCFAAGIDIVPALGLGLFWCKILTSICVPLSAGLLVGVAARQVEAAWKKRCAAS